MGTGSGWGDRGTSQVGWGFPGGWNRRGRRPGLVAVCSVLKSLQLEERVVLGPWGQVRQNPVAMMHTANAKKSNPRHRTPAGSRSRRRGGASPRPAPYDNVARHRPAPAGGPDEPNAAGSEAATPRSALGRSRWGGTPEAGSARRPHSAGAISGPLKCAGAMAPPTGTKWYGPRKRGGARVM